MARKVIFDTDPGIDDAMALRFIQCSPALDLLGITSVFGNATAAVTTRNARHLAARFGIDAPVAEGAADPIGSVRRPEPAHVHGLNGLGDIDLGAAPLAPLSPLPAPAFLIETIRRHPHVVTLIAVGPLTNLALALEAAPDIAGLVEAVIVMGGAFGHGPRRGNVSPVAEANVMNDPHAADRVVTAGWPVTMVGLDVTMRCVLDEAAARRMRDADAAGRFLWDISRDYTAMYRAGDGLDGCCLHDVAAVACAIEPGLFGRQTGPIRVVTDGIAIGQTIQQPAGQSFPPGDWDGFPAQAICRDAEGPGVVRLFVETLAAGPAEGR